MNMTKTAIKRGVTFAMIYLIAVGFGLFSLARLDMDLYPKLDFPVIAIITQYTGVGPFDMETVVTRPIEETVASVENVKKVSSKSKQGLSIVTLEFEWGTDMDQAEIDVRKNLEYIQDILPDDATDPLVFTFDPSMQPILYMAVGSKIHGLAELRRIAENDIEPRLERVPGVASAFTIGGLKREIRVLVDPAKMRAHHVSIQQITAALQRNNLQVPSGWIENDLTEFTIQTAGEYTNISQIENTNIAVINGSVIRVKDVAKVVDGFKEQRQRVWTDNRPAVIMIVQKQSDANTVNVTKELKSRFSQIISELPEGISFYTVWDQATFINRSMSNLGNTALQAIGLAFLVLLFFLRNVRSSLIVALSIPISMIVTFAVMDQAGVTLNIISMAGLALAVGMLVDNSIVVLEAIFRRREEGEAAREAAFNGTKEVAMAITASTLTTLSVFIPVLFVPGIAGELFNDMVLTICFSLGISLVVALTLVPLMASRLMEWRERGHKKGRAQKISETIGGWIASLQNFYSKSLKWSLAHRKTILFSTLGIFILSIFIMGTRGGEFLPHSDMGYLQIMIERSPGTSLTAMEKTVHEISRIIDEAVPEAEIIYTNFGQGEGVFAIFSSSGSNQGEVIIRLKKKSQRHRTAQQIEDALREKLESIPDLKITFEDHNMAMFGAGGDIVVEIFGHDLNVAQALANEIVNKVNKIRGVAHTETSIQDAAPELKIDLDRRLISDFGLATAQVGQVVSTSILGSTVTRYREGGDEYDIRVQLIKEARQSKSDLENILIMTPTGQQIPLRSIAKIEYTKAPTEINREDQERVVNVNIDISGRDLSSVTADVKSVLKKISVPNDFRIEIGGMAKEQQESFGYLALAMLAAMLLTYMVMASQFESFIDPLIILFTIPMSLIGVAFALLLTGTTLSVMALIGIIMLVGIVVNNGIVLVDYINQLRDQGMELFEAIHQAGMVRMRPVLMTALTTILAMLPLALGLGESGENWAPMARSVMGGLIVATALTLVVVPVIYAVLELWLQKFREKRAAKREAKMGADFVADNI